MPSKVDEEQFKKIMGYIDTGKSEGAKLNCGGKRKGDKGFYVEPTVFSEVRRTPSGGTSWLLRVVAHAWTTVCRIWRRQADKMLPSCAGGGSHEDRDGRDLWPSSEHLEVQEHRRGEHRRLSLDCVQRMATQLLCSVLATLCGLRLYCPRILPCSIMLLTLSLTTTWCLQLREPSHAALRTWSCLSLVRNRVGMSDTAPGAVSAPIVLLVPTIR